MRTARRALTTSLRSTGGPSIASCGIAGRSPTNRGWGAAVERPPLPFGRFQPCLGRLEGLSSGLGPREARMPQSIEMTRQQLYDLVWSRSMGDVAASIPMAHVSRPLRAHF
jgi:hypothetical protein